VPGVHTDDVAPQAGSANLYGSWFGFDGTSGEKVWFTYGIGSPASPTADQSTDLEAEGSYSVGVSTASDRTYQFRAKGLSSPGVLNGDILSFKSFALAPTAGTPASSAVTKNSATISCTYDAKVVESTFTVTLYYRKFGDSTWIAAGASQSSGTSISRNLSGLLGNTIYQFKLSGSRTTANQTDWESTVSNFTTLADTPTVTTTPASVVTSASANLNGTINPNNVANVTVQFGWGTADGGAVLGSWQNATATQAFSGGSAQGFSQTISGLSPSTPYFFRAFVNW
jgi:hypothetical protein